MTRFYYTDPLAAAWQAKHFGMRFTIRDGVYIPTWQELASSGNADGYFIHPDSLSLLKPKAGDMVETTYVLAEIVHHQDSEYMQSDFIRIIQRDNKPFFWPEREAV